VDYFIDQLVPDQYFYGYMICFLGYLAFGMLGSFFVIHFGLRAYWIGLVGLNSVFPDYSIEDSAYSRIYTEKMSNKLPKLPATIDSLDEICSVIFSAAFTLLLIYLYGGVLSTIYLLLFNVLKDSVPTTVLLIPLFLFLAIYVVMTFWSLLANIKKFKQNNLIQTWYYHIVIWGSKIFYGPLYKYSLQTSMVFGSNFKKKKALVKAVLFMFIFGMALGIFQIFQSNVLYLLRIDRKIDKTRVESNYYHDNNKEADFLLAPEIQTEIVTDNAIKLFIPLFTHETDIMKRTCDLKSLKNNEDADVSREKRWQANLDCFSATLKIRLNKKPVNVAFLKADHPETNQFGLTGFLKLTNTPEGVHNLIITKKVSSELERTWEIPFFYSPK